MKSITKVITSSALSAALTLGSVISVPAVSSVMNFTASAAEQTDSDENVAFSFSSEAKFKDTFTCSSNAVRINWEKVSNADGYTIYRYDDTSKSWKKYIKFYNNDITSFRDDYNIKAGNIYKYQIQAFAEKDNNVFVSEKSEEFAVAAKPIKPTITSTVSASNAVRLNWKGQDCSGYKVYKLVNNKWTLASTVNANVNTFKVSKLKAGDKCTLKIVPFVTYAEGKTLNGPESKAVTIATKTAAVSPKVEMPANVTGTKGKTFTVKASKNVGNFRVTDVKLTTKNVTYDFTYAADSVTFKFKKAGKSRAVITLKSTDGTVVTCFVNITIK